MNPEPELIIKAKWVGYPDHGDYMITDYYVTSLPYSISKFSDKTFVDVAKINTTLGDRSVYNGVRNIYLIPRLNILGFKIVESNEYGDPSGIVMCQLERMSSVNRTILFWDNRLPRRTQLTLLNTYRKQVNETMKEYDTWVQQHMDTTTTVLWTHVNASFGGNRFKVTTPKLSTPKPALEE